MTEPTAAAAREVEDIRRVVAAYVAAGADESVQRVITAVNRLSRRLTRRYDRQFAALGINGGEWIVLEQLARTDGDEPLTPTRLAAVSNVAPSSMTHRLDRLAARGLIAREADATNRTRVLVRLTDAGYEIFAKAIRDSDLVESDLLANLTAQQVDELGALLEQVIAGLEDAHL